MKFLDDRRMPGQAPDPGVTAATEPSTPGRETYRSPGVPCAASRVATTQGLDGGRASVCLGVVLDVAPKRSSPVEYGAAPAMQNCRQDIHHSTGQLCNVIWRRLNSP